MSSLLETKNLFVNIAGQTICQDLNLSIQANQCWGILGKNGAGKTTLLHTLAGLRTPDGGEVLFKQQNKSDYHSKQWAKHIGILFQTSEDYFPGTVLETALIGRHPHINKWQWESASDIELARQALKQTGLDGKEQQQVNTLSGGERRRLAIATLLTQSPDIMLLDEPANHLDLHYQVSLLKLMTTSINTAEKAIIMVMHDINMAARFCDHFIILYKDGKHQIGVKEDLLTERILSEVYEHPLSEQTTPAGVIFIPG